MNKKYCLVVKTGDAELRAIQHSSSEVMKAIFPLVELTRGRKLPSRKGRPDPVELYPFDKRLDLVKQLFKGMDVALDITTDERLINGQIKELYNPSEGYKNWVTFLKEIQSQGIFNSISPCVIIDASDENLSDNLANEVRSLSQAFDELVYRSDIYDDFCYEDIELIQNNLNGKRLVIVIDCSYIIQSSVISYEAKVKARIDNLKKILVGDTQIVVTGTSFPNNISEIGDDKSDTFSLCEVKLHESLKDGKIIYSDYGSINPVRNDTIVMARGWIPRIDVPLEEEVFYHRLRRPKNVTAYAETYSAVADLVVKDSRFPHYLSANWGVNQIMKCSEGTSPSSQPNFWISVRMCVHIETQLRRLKLL